MRPLSARAFRAGRLAQTFAHWLLSLVPPPLTARKRELWLGSLGAGIGLLAAEWVSRLALGMADPWFIAPMGASAVLLFALPASPLSQPWSILAGNLISSLIGVSFYKWLGPNGAGAALAVASAIAAMFALRCLHPPAGAVAMTAVIGGPAIQQLGYGFVTGPVLANSLLMVALAVALNRAAGRSYPHHASVKAHPHATNDPLPGSRLGYAKEDLDAALGSYGEPLDIGVDDLEEIMVRAHLHASRRRWGEVRCRDLMSRDVVTVGPAASLDEAWKRLGRHQIKALPVVDSDNKLVGILSLHDFFLKQGSGVGAHVPVMRAAHRVEEIMTRHVRVARPMQALVDLVEGFSSGGLHHMPVIDERDRVVGMITQSDVVAALLTTPGLATEAPAKLRLSRVAA